ncbi:FAD-dependent oxidoreductase [Ruegeria pomeroyi]|nr:FAD-dependent oxidoreductase [Ruegeria pomeroyi]
MRAGNLRPRGSHDHEAAMLVMFDRLDQAGVILHLDAISGPPARAGIRIGVVSAQGRLGQLRFLPRVVIDCSGKGDLSARIGVPYTLGDERGNMMAVSRTFHMVGADPQAVFTRGDPCFRHTRHYQGRLPSDLYKL